MAFDISTLVTDRTLSDVQAANEKGTYNAADLNRVTAAMEYLKGRLNNYGYSVGYTPIEIKHVRPLLPSGYTPLKYIESSGTQYVDTEFMPNQDTRVVVKYSGGEQISTAYGAIYGARIAKSNAGFYGFVSLDNSAYAFGYGTQHSTDMAATLGVHTVDHNKNVVTVDETQLTLTTEKFQSGFSLFLFATNTNGSLDSQTCKLAISFCQIYDNGTLVRDYVPCIDPDGEVGLYDLVSGVFYGNAGTGVFTAGEEVENVVPDETLDPYTWYDTDIPTQAQMALYLQNLSNIKTVLSVSRAAPVDMVGLTHEEANDIERILYECNETLIRVFAAFLRSGQFGLWSGERPLPTGDTDRGRTWAGLDAMGTTWANWQPATWYLLLYGNLKAEGTVT